MKMKRIVAIAFVVACMMVSFFLNSQEEDISEEDMTVFETEEVEEESTLEEVNFVRVVDGDTIIVKDASGANKRLRMIGIDTPESVAAEEERNNEYGVMASDYTKDLLKDCDKLYVEYDVDADDQYDRILAYLWLQEVSDTFDEDSIKNYMVNAIIVENGYGVAKTYNPTVAHDDFLHELTAEAREDSVGLWQYEGFVNLWNLDY